MNYDSLYSVSKAIAEKMGADSTKRYDSTYSVALEILSRMDSIGGGDASKLESVSEFPTENVKDGDVVYLKGNADNQDGFYVYSNGAWTLVSGGSSRMKTYTFNTLINQGTAGLSESERASMLQSVKDGENFRINIANSGYSYLAFGFYHTDTRAEVYFGFAGSNNRYYRYSTDTDKVSFFDTEGLEKQMQQALVKLKSIEDILSDGTVKFMESEPVDLLPENELAVIRTGNGYKTMIHHNYIKEELEALTYDTQYNYIKSVNNSASMLNFTFRYEFNFDDGTATIDISMNATSGNALNSNDTSILSNASAGTIKGNVWTIGEHKYAFNNSNYEMKISTVELSDRFSIHSIQTNLSGEFKPITEFNNGWESKACVRSEESENLQITPEAYDSGILNWYGTGKFTELYEDGTSLKNLYNPKNSTVENADGYKFPTWNSNGQITGSKYDCETKQIYINKSGSNDWGILIGKYLSEFPSRMVVATEFGTSGQILQSNGDNAAPTWTDMIKIQKITQDAYDALETKDENVLYVITDETV